MDEPVDILKFMATTQLGNYPNPSKFIWKEFVRRKKSSITHHDFIRKIEYLKNEGLIDESVDYNKAVCYKLNYKGELFLRDSLPFENPINQPNANPKNHNIAITKIKTVWVWLINNPMSASIIGGSVAIVVTTLILKFFHVI